MNIATAIRFAGLSIACSLFVFCMTGFITLLTGSLTVAAVELYSLLCAAASTAVFLTLRSGDSRYTDPSKKILLAALVFVVGGGLWIAFVSVQNISHPEPVLLPVVGAVVAGIGALINGSFGKTMQNMSDAQTPSLLVANAARLLTAGYVSIAAAIALLLINRTQLYRLDAVVALAIVLFTSWQAWKVTRTSAS
ncbi:cation efflux family protein [Aneurinibacillus soli]|uniref:Cation efflux family protein n=1 Tax=Aneurinibacillus soli TaxID=1500254 RepID=A0A0U5B005_9BACL|nr:cation transporter [Aneurinibacillus soli]PYE58158.1 cation efflux family protein [Aneurinibacillus soli]BAU27874.1 Cation efflux family protein [Aneurinibacillus soli]